LQRSSVCTDCNAHPHTHAPCTRASSRTCVHDAQPSTLASDLPSPGRSAARPRGLHRVLISSREWRRELGTALVPHRPGREHAHGAAAPPVRDLWGPRPQSSHRFVHDHAVRHQGREGRPSGAAAPLHRYGAPRGRLRMCAIPIWPFGPASCLQPCAACCSPHPPPPALTRPPPSPRPTLPACKCSPRRPRLGPTLPACTCSLRRPRLGPTLPACTCSLRRPRLGPTLPACTCSLRRPRLGPTLPACKCSLRRPRLGPTLPACKCSPRRPRLGPTLPACKCSPRRPRLGPTLPACKCSLRRPRLGPTLCMQVLTTAPSPRADSPCMQVLTTAPSPRADSRLRRRL